MKRKTLAFDNAPISLENSMHKNKKKWMSVSKNIETS